MNHKPLALILAACMSTPPPVTRSDVTPPRPSRPEPAEAMFGRADDRGRFLRITDFRIEDGKRFGWRIRLPCVGPVEYVETMVLPAPGDWRQIVENRRTDPEYLRETTISADGKTTVTHDYAACFDGWIEHGWTIAPGDPDGNWTIRVEIAGYAPQEWRVRFRR